MVRNAFVTLVVCRLLGGSTAMATSVAMLATSRSAPPSGKVATVVDRIRHALDAAGVGPLMQPADSAAQLAARGEGDSSKCKGQRTCLATLGKALGVDVLVVIDFATVGSMIGVHIEAIGSNDAKSLAATDLVWEGKGQVDVDPEAARFARNLAEALRPPSPPETTARPGPSSTEAQGSDVPVRPQSEPPVSVTAPATAVVISSPPPNTSHPPRTAAWIATGGAVAAGGVGVYFWVSALGAAGALNGAAAPSDCPTCYRLTQTQATTLMRQANTDTAVAIGVGAGAVVIAAVAVWLHLRD